MILKRILMPAFCVAAVIAVASVALAQAPAPQAAEQSVKSAASSLDKRALDALKMMSEIIAHAKTVKFQARSMVPVRTPDGIWINLYGTSQVVMQGPDKLFARTAGDFKPYDFYYDGKTITRYAPDKNLYSTRSEPGTIDDVIERAQKEEGRSFPYADILISEPYETMTDGLVAALYIGQSVIRPLSGQAGVKADHLAFANKGIQWQAWIGADDHLPRLVVATYLDDASEPSYSVEFGDWELNEPVDPATFIFNNTTGAAKIEFKNPVIPGTKGGAAK